MHFMVRMAWDATLSPRQREVARRIAGGASNRAIAADLELSPKTVEKHVSALFRKLGCRSRTQLTSVVLLRSSPFGHGRQ